MSNDERRAGDLAQGQHFREFGMDSIHRIADEPRWHGDTVLITCVNGCEVALDSDTVVEGMDFAPTEIRGTIVVANGKEIEFRIGNVAGEITYSQFGQVDEILFHTVDLLTGLVDKINEDDLLVVPCT